MNRIGSETNSSLKLQTSNSLVANFIQLVLILFFISCKNIEIPKDSVQKIPKCDLDISESLENNDYVISFLTNDDSCVISTINDIVKKSYEDSTFFQVLEAFNRNSDGFVSEEIMYHLIPILYENTSSLLTYLNKNQSATLNSRLVEALSMDAFDSDDHNLRIKEMKELVRNKSTNSNELKYILNLMSKIDPSIFK